MSPSSRGLAHEINKKRPFDCPEEEAYLNVLRTAAHLEADFTRLFRQHGLSESTYNVLRILRGAGPEGRKATEIACDMVVRVPDVTRLVDRLVEQGLVERRRCPEDRRVVHVTLTARGRALLGRLDAPVAGTHRAQLGHLTRAELNELNRLLVKSRQPTGPD